MLEQHPNEVNEEIEVSEKKKKEIIRRVQKEKNRNHTLQFSTKYAGIGANGSSKRDHVKNEEDKIKNSTQKDTK